MGLLPTFRNFFSRARILRIIHRALATVLIVFTLFLLLNLAFPMHVKIDYSQTVTAADGTVLHAFLTNDDKWRMMTELSEITPEMQKAIIFKEDKYFELHPGVNPLAICRALFNNIRTGHRTSGASTITMQVARMLEPKDRTYGNKAVEMFRALQLDMLYSKEEILQMYLNLVPYGGNIEGVKAASILYLQKMPAVLSLSELTALSIIPNRPTSLVPGQNNAQIIVERNKWLEKFRNADLFSDDIIDDALAEPFNAKRTEIPQLARHFSTRMRMEFPADPIIKTTLQPQLQSQCEEVMSNYVGQLWALDINNGAAIVIDNKSHKVVAYVGSANFFNERDGGQVDGVQAVRSPGSTLKPLLYAMAFDKGIYTPQSIVSDVPINYTGYRPENYDEDYHGNVSITYALANSLNVPAVKILHEIGMEDFLNMLQRAGFSSLTNQRKDLGLSVALGGCGITLEELTRAYSAFPNNGKSPHIRYLQSDNDTTATPVFTEAAAFMTTEILSELTRPDLPLFYQNAKKVPRVAWKTGTSYGRRDAWSIGYNEQYTVGVWVGNFSGRGVPELSGANVATPLLFNIFQVLGSDVDADWNRMPESVQFRYVCEVSGEIPTANCSHVVMDYFIPGISKNDSCTHLIDVMVDPKETISYCNTCKPETGYKVKQYQNYSPQIISWMQEKHLPFESIPPHNPKCERMFSDQMPSITSPADQMEYLIEKDDPQRIMLSANVASDVKTIFWYINDKLLTSVNAGEPVFFDPAEGKTKISCSDDKGRNVDIEIMVEFF